MGDSVGTRRVQLSRAHRDELEAILRAAGVDFAAQRPVVFGSRADGTARRYSDIDLGFAGEPLSAPRLALLAEAFEDSELPYRVDIVNLARGSALSKRESLADDLTTATAFLVKALAAEPSDIQQAAAIHAFEFCFELGWKLLKVRLRAEGLDLATPKAVLRAAGDAGMIASVEDWFGYLRARNLTSHTYNKTTADQVYAVISGGFVEAIWALV
jgi:nucleotidyltransferase substrate binding protein (TIGR01987 family)